jgi:phage terminase large subunit GpA-like protein
MQTAPRMATDTACSDCIEFYRRFSPSFGATELKNSTPGPGYCHFPIAYQQEFFNQLTSEEVRTRFVRGHPVRYWFKPSGKRNEALDRRVYALAALHSRRSRGRFSCAPRRPSRHRHDHRPTAVAHLGRPSRPRPAAPTAAPRPSRVRFRFRAGQG